MKQPVLLRIFLNGQLEEVKQLTQSQIVFGRNADVQVLLRGDQVSPLHALIEERDSGYYLSDLGSAIGTFRNGEKVLDEQLQSGDEIAIGPYTVQFFVGVPKPTAPPVDVPNVVPATPPPKVNIPKNIPDETIFRKQPKHHEEEPPKLKHKHHDDEPPKLKHKHHEPEKPVKRAKIVKSGEGTFAPPNKHKHAHDIIKPDKGSVVEVVLAWQERILDSYHFHTPQVVTIGLDNKATISMPLPGSTKHTRALLRIDSLVTVFVPMEAAGEVHKGSAKTSFSEMTQKGKVRQGPGGFEIPLNQGEMVHMSFGDGQLNIYVRFVPDTPKPVVAPLLDLTASEVTGVILAGVVAAIFGLYMMIYSPAPNEDLLQEEVMRKAVITFDPPIKKQVVEVTEAPPQEKPQKKIVEVKEKVEKPVPAPPTKASQGKAAEVRKFETESKKKQVTSAKSGGAIKTGKDGASATSEKKDVNKMGLLGVFGARGTQTKLDQVYSGSGELTGAADQATGFAGSKDARPGDNIGTALKDGGASGKGKATIGIAGVGTQGRGTGNYGLGAGGLEKKGSVDINVGGQGAIFEGSIDREAIRRVIQSNKRAIADCYNRELNKNPDLYGKIVIEWDIEEQGRVSRTSIASNSLASDEVGNCIMRRLKTWRFPEPPPDQVARVRYPFVFTAQ